MQASNVEAKPEITIGVLGQDGHGKTTLTAAIVQYLSQQGSSVVAGNEVVINIEDDVEGDRSRTSVYETELRRYKHVDCRSHRDIVKNFILNRIPLHGAILVVSAVDGVTSQMREQVRLAHIAGVSAIVVFLNKCDLTDDAKLLEKVEMDARKLLLSHSYSDDDPIIRGSATAARNNLETGVFDLWTSKIRELPDALDAAIPASQRIEDKPFLMHIQEAFYISGKGNTIAIGWIERGSIRMNAGVEISMCSLRSLT